MMKSSHSQKEKISHVNSGADDDGQPFLITNDNWVVSLVRNPANQNSQHSFLIIEGIENDKEKLFLIDFVGKNDSCTTGAGKVRIEEYPKDTHHNKKPLLFRSDIALMKITAETNLMGLSWNISSNNSKRIIINARLAKEKPPSFYITGHGSLITHAVEKFGELIGKGNIEWNKTTDGSYNCYSWARQLLKDSVLSEDKPRFDNLSSSLDSLASLPLNYLRNTLEPSIELEESDRYIIRNIKQQNINFTGRVKELKQLKTFLEENTAPQIIYGPGGIGKSQLSKRYAKENETDYNIIWHFDATKGNDLDNQFTALANDINANYEELVIQPINTDHIIDIEKKRVEVVRQVLDRLRVMKQDYLLIFDDVFDRNIVTNYLPVIDADNNSNKKNIIITSRHSTCWSDYHFLNLDVFSREESVLFLMRAMGTLNEDEREIEELTNKITRFTEINTEKLAEELDPNNEMLSSEEKQTFYLTEALHDYPLALAQAAAYIKTKIKSGSQDQKLKKYLDLFAQKKSKLQEAEQRLLKEGNQVMDDYRRTISTTLELSFDAIAEQSQMARDILNMLRFLYNKEISIDIIKTFVEKLGGDIDFDLDDIVDQLTKQSIITIEASDAVETVCSMHDMVQEVLLEQKDNEGEFQQYWVNTLKTLHNVGRAYDNDDDKNYILTKHLNSCLSVVGDEFIKQQLDTQSYEEIGCIIAHSYDNIGITYQSQGKINEALEQHIKALEIHKKNAPDSVDIARSYNNIGAAYYAQGKLDEALIQFRQALKIQEKQAPDSFSLATTHNHIGLIYKSQGKLEEALGKFKKALVIQEKLNIAENCPITYNNIGLVLKSQGKLNEALERFKQALKAVENKSPNSLALAGIYNNMGMIYHLEDRPLEALEQLEKSLKIRERKAPNSLALAESINNIGLVYRSQGRMDEAFVQYQKSFKIREEKAPNSLALANSYDSLGVLLGYKGDWDGASRNFEEAFEIRKDKAPDSLEIANSYHSIGQLYLLRGDDRALDLLIKSRNIREKQAPDSLDLANSYNDIGSLKHLNGDFKGAIIYFKKASEIRERKAPASTDLAKSYDNIGKSYLCLRGSKHKALKWYQKALKVAEEKDQDGLMFASICNNIGAILLDQDNLNAAYEKLQISKTEVHPNFNLQNR